MVEEAAVTPADATALRVSAKAYLRIGHAEDDSPTQEAALAAFNLCEAFIGQLLIARNCTEIIEASGTWVRLRRSPVAAITAVDQILEEGTPSPLAADLYAMDIDVTGDGWVRVAGNGVFKRARVHYRAGLAADWESAPAGLRQGVVRLAAHLFAQRDAGAASAPPAAVTALWRPWRRVRL